MSVVNKSTWFKYLIARMSKALESEYYFEAILIAHLIIDDRMESLCKIRDVSIMEKKTIYGKTREIRKDFSDLVYELKNPPAGMETDCFNKQLCKATLDEIEEILSDEYFAKLSALLKSPRKLYAYKIKNGKKVSIYQWSKQKSTRGILDYISKWREQRNHWVHNAANDKITEDELIAILRPFALDGVILARELCDFINRNNKHFCRQLKEYKKRIR